MALANARPVGNNDPRLPSIAPLFCGEEVSQIIQLLRLDKAFKDTLAPPLRDWCEYLCLDRAQKISLLADVVDHITVTRTWRLEHVAQILPFGRHIDANHRQGNTRQ
ncbi:hypothetical protein D3C79_968990 [compost metagenome]